MEGRWGLCLFSKLRVRSHYAVAKANAKPSFDVCRRCKNYIGFAKSPFVGDVAVAIA